MFRLIPFLILVIDVLVVIDILRSKMDNERKILWIIAVVFLPILGPILYYIFNKR